MVINLSGHSIIKKSKFYAKMIILLIIVFYILPKLLSMLWYLSPTEDKIRQEHLLEKPMRVGMDIRNWV